jgi:adenylate cyclase
MWAKAKSMAEAAFQDMKPIDSQTAWAQMLWYAYLTGDNSQLDTKVKTIRQVFKRLPSPPRCKVCNAPFTGIGGALVKPFGFGSGRSSFNLNLCDRCEKIVKKYQVGMELRLTMLFADVRGSTALAEEIGPSQFHQLINRYYQTSAQVLGNSDALVNRLIGDALIGLYVPGIAGPEHTRAAVEAARALLEATGHTDPNGPWIHVGIGVHTGTAYVGAVGGADSVSDITVLGDAANTAARLSAEAAGGEILVSEETARAANLGLEDYEQRTLKLKGRTEPVAVRVIRVAAA